MKLLLQKDEISQYISKQLDTNFAYGTKSQTLAELKSVIPSALERTDFCFSRIKAKHFRKDGEAFFNPFITDQYAMFLYFLANSAAQNESTRLLADRLYALNKMLHAVDIYHQVELPKVFLLVHSVGTVLGRAEYGEYLVVYQGVTVGGTLDEEYPVIGSRVSLFANSSVLGKAQIGDDVMVSSRAFVMNEIIPSGHIGFGISPNIAYKTRSNDYTEFIL